MWACFLDIHASAVHHPVPEDTVTPGWIEQMDRKRLSASMDQTRRNAHCRDRSIYDPIVDPGQGG